MKIVLTGGGSGGHFYPLIAVAEAIREEARSAQLIEPELYFLSPSPYQQKLLFTNRISFIKIPAGKIRRYFSFKNITDIAHTLLGIIKALVILFKIYPDVVFGKGGYGSFPTIFAARLLRIPVVIHESDAFPGRMNKWAGKFAQRIAISFADTAQFFPRDKVALTGIPLRREIRKPNRAPTEPKQTILILGGSQGSETINNTVVEALPLLIQNYRIIHQTGKLNYEKTLQNASFFLESSESEKDSYHPTPYLSTEEMSDAGAEASLVISRAGATTLAEISSWNKPAIIIPITDSNGDHQRKNAFIYAEYTGASVIEEKNLSSHILSAGVDRILKNPEKYHALTQTAGKFYHPDAGGIIAQELLHIALSHNT